MTLDYLAGLIDGEGHLQLIRGGDRFNADWRQARLRISMTDDAPLRAAHAAFGGCFYGPYVQRTQPHTKPYFIWVVAKRDDLLPLLKAVSPKLYIKREKAEEMIRYIEAVPKHKQRGKSVERLSR